MTWSQWWNQLNWSALSPSSISDNLNDWLDQYNIFTGLEFHILYDWLPSDIAAAITASIVILLILSILGLIKKFLAW